MAERKLGSSFVFKLLGDAPLSVFGFAIARWRRNETNVVRALLVAKWPGERGDINRRTQRGSLSNQAVHNNKHQQRRVLGQSTSDTS